MLATAWQLVRLVLQFAYLVLVARVLGVEGYGVFAGSVALASSLSLLVGLGFGMLLVQEVSRAPECFPEFWAKTLRAVGASGPIITGVMLALAPLLLPVDGHWTVIVLIAAAELLAMPFIVAGSLAFQAHERLGRKMFNHVQLNLARLGAVVVLMAVGQNGLVPFAWAYFVSTCAVALLSLFQVVQTFGRPDWARAGLTGRLREALGFSLIIVANTAHAEIDKVLLLRLGTASAAGNYSVANRVVAAATTPLVAYILAVVPRLFREGGHGTHAASTMAWRLLPPILLYGTAAAAGLLVCSPLVPLVFGDSFTATTSIINWLAPLPLLTGVSLLSLNVLSASGFQKTRVLIEGFALLVNIAMNLILIPSVGAMSAITAVLISQSVLVLFPVLVVLYIRFNPPYNVAKS